MSNLILVLILTAPITLLPLVHLVTGCEGNTLLIATVFVQMTLLLMTIAFGDKQ
jgi:hypothetical protein